MRPNRVIAISAGASGRALESWLSLLLEGGEALPDDEVIEERDEGLDLDGLAGRMVPLVPTLRPTPTSPLSLGGITIRNDNAQGADSAFDRQCSMKYVRLIKSPGDDLNAVRQSNAGEA